MWWSDIKNLHHQNNLLRRSTSSGRGGFVVDCDDDLFSNQDPEPHSLCSISLARYSCCSRPRLLGGLPMMHFHDDIPQFLFLSTTPFYWTVTALRGILLPFLSFIFLYLPDGRLDRWAGGFSLFASVLPHLFQESKGRGCHLRMLSPFEQIAFVN